MLSPKEYYLHKKEHFSSLQDKANRQYNTVATLRLLSAVLAIGFGIAAAVTGKGWEWYIAGVVTAVFIVLVRIHLRLSALLQRLHVNLSIIDRELLSLLGDNSAFVDGATYMDTNHPYSFDLDIFGKGSIYQMLCRTVTYGGAVMLADRLKKLSLKQEIVASRQAIVKELSAMPEMLQEYRVAGELGKESELDQLKMTQWLQGNDLFINDRLVQVLIFLMPALSVLFLIWSIAIGGVHTGLIAVVFANWMILGAYQKKIKPSARQLDNATQLVIKYENLLQVIEKPDHSEPWLKETAINARTSLGSIRKLKSLMRLFESRGNGLVWPVVNTFFLFDLYCLLRLEWWRRKHNKYMLQAIDSIISMDVYVSCAVYAFNNPDHVYPQLTAAGSGIKGKDLRHPLLNPETAIGNDVNLGEHEQFYLLTGANMTGKSTFIRTIGVSNVLCNIGVPLPAKELSMPLLALYTSMRITDSVQEDISYFRAELNRVKSIMDVLGADKQQYLVLLDEPLRGTNSTDKQQGTRSILEKLLTYHAIGIVATHDTGLCNVEATSNGRVNNYHFESSISTEGLSFDFKLQKGCSTSNNATLLMRQMGIIE